MTREADGAVKSQQLLHKQQQQASALLCAVLLMPLVPERWQQHPHLAVQLQQQQQRSSGPCVVDVTF